MNRGGADSDYKTQVLAAVDIVELIGRTVALKRRGKDYVGLCPFHQEKTPSFHVSPGKQYFHCYGCKVGGNAIDFVIRRDRVEFIDALRTLGQQAGIEMPKFGLSKEKTGERQMLLEAHSAACAFFEKLLDHPQQGLTARRYLEQRGFDQAMVKAFQVGFAPDSWDGLLKALGRKYMPQQLATAGLAKPRERGEGFYDTFRNRLIFPIRDENGRIIAFGGRVMPGSQDPAKYLNSPETPLFSKSRSVFGLDLARQKIVESRTVVVVEGYTDVIMAHQYGVGNVVSILGTAMTEQHVGLLRRFADRIVLLFDADTAGDAAVDKAVGLFLTQPVEIAIASMPPDVDPDEYLLKNGAEAFEKLVAGAADALSYKWKRLSRRFNATGDLTAQHTAVEEYLASLAEARGSGPVDALRWGSALARVSRLTEIPVDELSRRFRTKRGPTRPAADVKPQTVTPRRPLTAVDRAERWILGVLLLEPNRWHKVQRLIAPENFTEPKHRQLAEIYWQHQRDEGEPVFNEFLGLLQDSDLVELAIEAVDEIEGLADVENTIENTLDEAMLHVQRARGVKEEQKLLAELRGSGAEPLAEQDEIDLLRQLQEKARQPDLRRA